MGVGYFMGIMQDVLTVRRKTARLMLCVALSLLVHGLLAWGLWMEMQAVGGVVRKGENKRPVQRALQIVMEEPQAEKQKPFAKTDPDQEEVAPQQADFVGARNARESAAEFAPNRRSDAPVPSQNGDENDDLVTFDQHAQRGDLEYDGKAERRTPPTAVGLPLPPAPPPQPAVQSADTEQLETPAEGAASVQQAPPDEEGDVRIRQASDEPAPASVPPIQIPVKTPPRPAVPRGAATPVYDPSLADHMQQTRPGFRTLERRTRSTGRFVIGRRASLNVAATPQGRYEEEVYRRIAYFWYIACDEHRGDIIPGSVVISLRINSRGLLENMDLVRRTGASISQQSFTLGAIRRATLPPMPPAVRQELVGDLLELIFQFNFD